MERNLLYNEILNLNNAGTVGDKEFFFAANLPLSAFNLAQIVYKEEQLEKNGYAQSSLYNGLSLQIGDNDANGIYAGVANQTKSNYVKKLQTNLSDLGIKIRTKNPDGIFDFETELAVREFQIYSKMEFIAVSTIGVDQYYGQSFIQNSNDAIYYGLVNGVVNDETRRRIQFWNTNKYRCPVIVQAWNLTADKKARKGIVPGKDNIWHYKEVLDSKPRMYVRDFTNYYIIPKHRLDKGFTAVGYYSPYSRFGGPSSEANVSWNEAEITPGLFLNKPFSSLTTNEKSTFKIIRAVSEVECGGRVDKMNAYDDAFISFGPFHWVFAIFSYVDVDKKNPAKGKKIILSKGEIAAYFGFLKEKDPTAFRNSCSFFGVDVNLDWNTDGANYFERGQRKYVKGKLKLKRATGFLEMPDEGDDGMSFCNYFRSWHWFYRFIMAARSITGFQKYMFDFSIYRLRNLLELAVENFNFKDSNNNAYKPKLGEIFTSEKAIAMVLRVHVRAPAFVTNLGKADTKKHKSVSTFRTILANSMATMEAQNLADVHTPSLWNDNHENILIDTIKNFTYSINGLNTSVPQVCDYGGYGPLSAVRNSFKLL